MKNNFTLNIDFSNAALTAEEISEAETKIRTHGTPKFATYSPDMKMIEEIRSKYQNKKNFIIEGNGGSISTLRGFLSCFGDDTQKNVFILDTDDPDHINELRKKCKKEDTLFVVINRSGNSIQTISGYLALKDYETVFITAAGSTLFNIGQLQDIPSYDKTSEHPEFAGRFSGLTEFGLLPAAMLGMDTDAMLAGGKEMYEKCAPQSPFKDNPALQFALALDKLEKLGYTGLFLSIYSKKLGGFFELIVQLFHESVCKDGKGQTIYGGDAPENQHHTLQRFNSGRQDSVGVFMTVEKFTNDIIFTAPENIKDVECRKIPIEKLAKLSMADIIHTEFEGTWKDTTEKGIPAIHLELGEVSPETAGMLTAFFQYAACYSAMLRDVNPFDQPGVERSKEYIFQLVEQK